MMRLNNNRQPPKGAPKWFREFFSNDYAHLANDVKANTRLLWVILVAIIATAVKIIMESGA